MTDLKAAGLSLLVAASLVMGVGNAGSPAASAVTADTLAPSLTQPACTDVRATVSTFHLGLPVVEWRENLAFDGNGLMWVTRPVVDPVAGLGLVEAYSPDGALQKTLELPQPQGIREYGGQMFVNSGGNTIVRFDPRADHPVPEPFATGLNGGNGLAVDDDGNFYVGPESSNPVIKVTSDGVVDNNWATAEGVNGVSVSEDGHLYGAVTKDQRSRVVNIPLAAPTQYSTLTYLSSGAVTLAPSLVPPVLTEPLLPKGPDDLEVGPHDALYVAAFLAGELLRVDRRTGMACVLVSGLLTPTSVRFPVGFGPYQRASDMFVTEASGRILRVHVEGKTS